MFYISSFFLIGFLYFNKAITAKNIFIERDLSIFFLPPKYLWVNLIKSFTIPLWNPYNYSGIPLLATLQPGIFYPPNILYLFLPFNIVWNWMIMLHFIFAGINLYFFLNYLKCSREASFVGGIIFMLSGYLLSVHNLLPHLLSVSWFPLVPMFFLKYLKKQKIKYAVIASICLSMEFFAGAPEVVIMSVFILIIFSVFFPLFFDNSDIKLCSRIMSLSIVCLIFLLICSVQLLPFYELSSNSIRKGGLSYQEAITWSFSWKDIVQFFIHNPYEYYKNLETYWSNQTWLKSLYLGISPFILSIFYFISKDKKRPLFFLLIIISFIFALGGNTPIYRIIYEIPPFNSIRYPVKFLFIFFFVIAITSGLGYDQLKKGIEEKNPNTKNIILTIFYAGFIFSLLWGFFSFFNNEIYAFFDKNNIKPEKYNDIDYNIHNLKRFFFYSFLFCTILLFALRLKYKKIALFGIIILITFDLFSATYNYYSMLPWDNYKKNNDFVDKIQNSETRRYMVAPLTEDEFYSSLDDKSILNSPYSALYNLHSIKGAEVLRVLNHEHFTNILYSTKSIEEAKRYFDVSGIGYIITINKIEDKDFRQVESIDAGDKKVYLYEYLSQPGRFLFFQEALYIQNEKDIINKLTDKNIDLNKKLILLSNEKNIEYKYGRSSGTAETNLISYKPNRVVIECKTDEDGFLYISDTYYPGWKAYVNGKQTKIYRANLAFRAVEISAGKNLIIFEYAPLSFYVGIILTLIGIMLSIILLIKDVKKRKNMNLSIEQR